MTRTHALLIGLLAFASAVSAFAQDGSLFLVGGGEEAYGAWSDEPYQWFVQQSGNGVILNIDVNFTSGWYEGYFQSFGADPSSTSLRITASDANDDNIYQALIAADGIFIEDGDVIDYIDAWANTLVEDAIEFAYNNGAAVGGIGGGMRFLGGIIYDAANGEVPPDVAAYNPYDTQITFTEDALQILPNTLLDSEFLIEGRLPRLVTMLARKIVDDNAPEMMGIGVGRNSAIGIYPNGDAVTFGRSVTFLSAVAESEISVSPGQPVHFTEIRFDQMLDGSIYSIPQRRILDPGPTNMDWQDWTIAPPVDYSELSLNGGSEVIQFAGEVRIEDFTANPDAWKTGDLMLDDGSGQLPRTCIVPLVFDDLIYLPNRLVGGQYAAVANQGFATIWLDNGSSVQIDDNGVMTVAGLAYAFRTEFAPALGLDTNNIPGIAGGRLFALTDGDVLDLARLHANVDEKSNGEAAVLPQTIQLLPVYPNPFNGTAAVSFTLPYPQHLTLAVYDRLGRRVTTLLDAPSPAGYHTLSWIPDGNVASGLYLLQLEAGDKTSTQRVTLVK